MIVSRPAIPIGATLLLSAWAASLNLAADPPAAADFYVATTGRDDNPGTLERPFATLARARDAVRRLKQVGGRTADVTVLIRGGTYALTEHVTFGPADSGSADRRITYAAFPGEQPVLSGGRAIADWKPGEGKSWVAAVPAVKGGAWRFTQLFVNGRRQTRARIPDTDDWNQWWRVEPGAKHAAAFRFPKGTVKKWPNVEDVEITLIPQYYWQDQIMPLQSVDEAEQTARLACDLPAYAVCPGDPFRVENVPEGVSRPGTWCLDTQTQTVTLWPEEGADPRNLTVTAPLPSLLLSLEGEEEKGRLVQHLTFRGLTFTQTARVPLPERDPNDTGTLDANESAVLLRGAAHCTIEGCRFVETGAYGIRLKHYATGHRIVANEFVGCGGGGVLLTGYGPGTRDVCKGNRIVQNHIHHCALFYGHAAGIALTQSGENLIAFNHIHDMPYGGIFAADCSVDYFREFRGKQGRGFQFRWDEIGDDPLTARSVKRFTHTRRNRIVHNTIHQVMQRLYDGGGIHLGFVGGENVIRGNLIHGSHAAWMGVGIYTDAGTNHEVIDGNVVWDCSVPVFDNGEDGPNNNRWGENWASKERKEPPQAQTLRDAIAAKLKKGWGATGEEP
jgi:hypothetical protein